MKTFLSSLFIFIMTTHLFASEKRDFEPNDSNFTASNKKIKLLPNRSVINELNHDFVASYGIPTHHYEPFGLNSDLNHHLINFLTPKDVGMLSRASQSDHDVYSDRAGSFGRSHREASEFAVTDLDGRVYYLEEFLSLPTRREVSQVKNVNRLLLNRPEDFFRFVMKSMPTPSEMFKEKINTYVYDILKIDDHLQNIKTGESSCEKIYSLAVYSSFFRRDAGFLWDYLRVKFNNLQTFFYYYPVHTDGIEEIEARINDLKSDYDHNGFDEVYHWDDMEEKQAHLISKQHDHAVWESLWFTVNEQIEDDVEKLKFHEATFPPEDLKFDQKIRQTIEYISLIHHFGSLAMVQSAHLQKDVFNPNGLLKEFKENMDEMRLKEIIEQSDTIQIRNDFILSKSQLAIYLKHINSKKT